MNILFLAWISSGVPELPFGASSASGKTAAWLLRVQTRIVCMCCLFVSSNRSGQNGLHAQYLLFFPHWVNFCREISPIIGVSQTLAWVLPEYNILRIRDYLQCVLRDHTVYSHGSKSQTLRRAILMFVFPFATEFSQLTKTQTVSLPAFCRFSLSTFLSTEFVLRPAPAGFLWFSGWLLIQLVEGVWVRLQHLAFYW